MMNPLEQPASAIDETFAKATRLDEGDKAALNARADDHATVAGEDVAVPPEWEADRPAAGVDVGQEARTNADQPAPGDACRRES